MPNTSVQRSILDYIADGVSPWADVPVAPLQTDFTPLPFRLAAGLQPIPLSSANSGIPTTVQPNVPQPTLSPGDLAAQTANSLTLPAAAQAPTMINRNPQGMGATDIPNTPAPITSAAPAGGNAPQAPSYDGLCRLPDGSIHPYTNAGGGYVNIQKSASPSLGPQAAVAQAGNGTAMPTLTKRGGVAGGGVSGNVTSPASKALRDMTGGARINELQPITGTSSIGGSLGRAIPYLGTGLMALDFLNQANAPVCLPVRDPTKIY